MTIKNYKYVTENNKEFQGNHLSIKPVFCFSCTDWARFTLNDWFLRRLDICWPWVLPY